MALKKTLILICFILLGFQLNAQPIDKVEKQTIEAVSSFAQYDIIDFEVDQIDEIVLKKIDPISADPYAQSKMINYEKSKEIISIKAYRKALQLKGKETLMS